MLNQSNGVKVILPESFHVADQDMGIPRLFHSRTCVSRCM